MVKGQMSKVILIRGKAGTGKSTLANALGRKLNVTILHKDDIYDTVAAFVNNHGDRNKICFDLLHKILISSLNSKVDIIIDFGYNNLDDVEKLKAWVKQHNGEWKSIICTCDDKVWAERLNQRKLNPLPNQLLTDVEDLKKHYSNVRTGILEGELVLNTSLDINHLVNQAVNYLI